MCQCEYMKAGEVGWNFGKKGMCKNPLTVSFTADGTLWGTTFVTIVLAIAAPFFSGLQAKSIHELCNTALRLFLWDYPNLHMALSLLYSLLIGYKQLTILIEKFFLLHLELQLIMMFLLSLSSWFVVHLFSGAASFVFQLRVSSTGTHSHFGFMKPHV